MLKNHGKKFFMELAAASIIVVNRQVDKRGINYGKKVMIRCGLSLNVTGH